VIANRHCCKNIVQKINTVEKICHARALLQMWEKKNIASNIVQKEHIFNIVEPRTQLQTWANKNIMKL
jgi:hypothetical protein